MNPNSREDDKAKCKANVSLLHLPDELMLKILDHLALSDLAAGLCFLGDKRLQRICRDPKFCTVVDIAGSWDADTALKVVLMVSGPYLQALGLKHRDDDANALALLALEGSPNLEKLVFADEVFLSDAVMSAIGREGGSVRKIILRGAKKDFPTRDLSIRLPDHLNEILVSNANNLRNITYISIGRFHHRFEDDLIRAIAYSCEQLEYLEIQSMIPISDQIFRYLLDQVCGTLKHLCLRFFPYAPLTDASHSLRRCHHLERIKLQVELGPGGIRAIAGLLNLRHIDFTNSFLDQSCFAQALSGGNTIMHKLTSLYLHYCGYYLDDDDLEAIAASCPNLEQLDISGCKRVGDRGMVSVLRQCKSLVCLFLNFGTGVTSKALIGPTILRLKYFVARKDLMAEIARAMPECEFFRGACLQCPCSGPSGLHQGFTFISSDRSKIPCRSCGCLLSMHRNINPL